MSGLRHLAQDLRHRRRLLGDLVLERERLVTPLLDHPLGASDRVALGADALEQGGGKSLGLRGLQGLLPLIVEPREQLEIAFECLETLAQRLEPGAETLVQTEPFALDVEEDGLARPRGDALQRHGSALGGALPHARKPLRDGDHRGGGLGARSDLAQKGLHLPGALRDLGGRDDLRLLDLGLRGLGLRLLAPSQRRAEQQRGAQDTRQQHAPACREPRHGEPKGRGSRHAAIR